MITEKTFKAAGTKAYQFELCSVEVGDKLDVWPDLDKPGAYELISNNRDTVGRLSANHWISIDLEKGRFLLNATVVAADQDYFGEISLRVKASTGDDPDEKPASVTIAKTYRVNIVGESYRQEAIAKCAVGEKVMLAHDSKNEHDPRAIAVLSVRYEQIGFLPRDGWLTGALIDEAKSFKATIADLHKGSGSRPHTAVVLEVALAS